MPRKLALRTFYLLLLAVVAFGLALREALRGPTKLREDSDRLFAYSSAAAFVHRRLTLREACPEASEAAQKASDREGARRLFLLNHGLSVCVPEFSRSAMLTSVFLALFEAHSESELSLLAPCKRREAEEESKRRAEESWIAANDSDYSGRAKMKLKLSILIIPHNISRVIFRAVKDAYWQSGSFVGCNLYRQKERE